MSFGGKTRPRDEAQTLEVPLVVAFVLHQRLAGPEKGLGDRPLVSRIRAEGVPEVRAAGVPADTEHAGQVRVLEGERVVAERVF